MKKILFILALIILTIGLMIFSREKEDVEINKIKSNISVDENYERLSNEVLDELVPSQNKFIKETGLIVQGNENDASSRFLDLMAPLGVLDPLANEKGSEDIIQINNILFGYHGRQVGVSKDRISILLESPLRYGLTEFDYADYFNKNKNIFDDLHDDLNLNTQDNIIGFWSSGLYRLDDIFGDLQTGLVWEMKENDSNIYDYSDIYIYNHDEVPENLIVNYDEMTPVFKMMSSINVTTMYKCGDLSIFILGATSNNAFGFVHGAESAEEINCGLLSNRFRIEKDVKLDSEWRYWVGK